jgi:hypothetical protein
MTKGQASQLLGTVGLVTSDGSPSDCTYTIGDKAQLATISALDQARQRQILSAISALQHAGMKHPIAVDGSKGYWCSVTTTFGSGTDVFVFPAGKIDEVQVTGTSRSLQKALAAMKILERHS